MKTYKITTTCTVEVKAEDEDEAFQRVNRDNDYGDVVNQDIEDRENDICKIYNTIW